MSFKTLTVIFVIAIRLRAEAAGAEVFYSYYAKLLLSEKQSRAEAAGAVVLFKGVVSNDETNQNH